MILYRVAFRVEVPKSNEDDADNIFDIMDGIYNEYCLCPYDSCTWQKEDGTLVCEMEFDANKIPKQEYLDKKFKGKDAEYDLWIKYKFDKPEQLEEEVKAIIIWNQNQYDHLLKDMRDTSRVFEYIRRMKKVFNAVSIGMEL